MNKSIRPWMSYILSACVFFSLFLFSSVVKGQQLTDEEESQKSTVIINTERFSLELRGRLQLRYSYINPETGDKSGSFSVRRARLTLRGDAYNDFSYSIQMDAAGSSVNLLDANISYHLSPLTSLWVGQGKTPFGRQQFTSSGSLNFVDRSTVNSRFTAGRQAGLALMGHNSGETVEYAVGVYNGTGINSANNNNKYMKIARVVFTPLGAYPRVESALDYPDTPRLALGVSGLHTTSTSGSEIETDITRINTEGAFKMKGFSLLAEYFWESAKPTSSDALKTSGMHAQAGYLLADRKNEIVLRYAVISPDVPGSVDVIETGVALNHYVSGHNAKIQADLRNVNRKALGTNDIEFRLQLQISL